MEQQQQQQQQECRDSLRVLPAELWTHIAEQTPVSWFALCLTLRWLGLYSLDKHVQQKLMDRWVNDTTGLLPNGAKHGMHVNAYGVARTRSEVTRWYRKGVVHRDDGAAVIHRFSDGALLAEDWYRNGVQHRDGDLPAGKSYHCKGGTLSYEIWWRNGVKHRDGDLPTEKGYREDGTLTREIWHRNGQLHRDDGDMPAVIFYREDGTTVTREIWYRNGVKNRGILGEDSANDVWYQKKTSKNFRGRGTLDRSKNF